MANNQEIQKYLAYKKHNFKMNRPYFQKYPSLQESGKGLKNACFFSKITERNAV